jgi:general secretion pathway protein G
MPQSKALEDSPSSDDSKHSRFARVVVAVILAIVTLVIGSIGIASYSLKKTATMAKWSQVEADFKSLESALQMYRLTCGTYPTTEQGLKALVERPVVSPVPTRWVQIFKRDFKDSWGNSFGYKFPSRNDPTKPEIICKGPDGIEATKDDVSSQSD